MVVLDVQYVYIYRLLLLAVSSYVYNHWLPCPNVVVVLYDRV
jgi:hypothetical protein